jgi:thiol-disulfide isomerase/thioredoxin
MSWRDSSRYPEAPVFRIVPLSLAAVALIASCATPTVPGEFGRTLVPASSQPPVGQIIDFEFTDIEGRTSWLSDLRGHDAYVVVMRDIGCPVTAKYAPRLAQIEQAYAPQRVAFLYLNVNESNSLEEIRDSEIARHGYKGHYIHDPSGRLGKLLGVRSTTETFVLDRQRRLQYRGAVDDQYGVGWARKEPRNRYLEPALDSVLAGSDVAVTATDASGCLLPFGTTAETAAGPVTYHREISRIVQQNCQGCHRSDGMAPFALETYEQVHARRTMIRQMVKTRRMPPWFAHRDVGSFANDRGLSESDLYTLLRWVDEGSPAGDVADAPPAREWPSSRVASDSSRGMRRAIRACRIRQEWPSACPGERG